MGIITPNSAPALVSRGICVPDSEEWHAVISGLLDKLADVWSWQEVDGISPEDAAAVGAEILWSWLDGGCAAVEKDHMVIVKAIGQNLDDTPHYENLAEGEHIVTGWCGALSVDTQFTAVIDGDDLTLPAGWWKYETNVSLSSNIAGPATAEVFIRAGEANQSGQPRVLTTLTGAHLPQPVWASGAILSDGVTPVQQWVYSGGSRTEIMYNSRDEYTDYSFTVFQKINDAAVVE